MLPAGNAWQLRHTPGTDWIGAAAVETFRLRTVEVFLGARVVVGIQILLSLAKYELHRVYHIQQAVEAVLVRHSHPHLK